mmetsp:Transcript_13733/g.39392  ORF Transcript_13733/g.39392 Transcript_13733/m.39392 type:complete len:231 (+) Transcript_13733:483-1175(+)
MYVGRHQKTTNSLVLRQQGLDLLHKRRLSPLRGSQGSQLRQSSQYRSPLKYQSLLNRLGEQWFEQTNKGLQHKGQVEDHGGSSETGIQILVPVRAGREGLGESPIGGLPDAADIIGKDHRAHSTRLLRSRIGNEVVHLLGIQEEIANLLDGGLVHELLIIDGTRADHVHQIAIVGTERDDALGADVLVDDGGMRGGVADRLVVPSAVGGGRGHGLGGGIDNVLAGTPAPR